MKKLLLAGALALLCFGADSDLDGVPDNLDFCPNTPFLEIVDKNGCSKEQLKELKKKKISYFLSIGFEYDNYKDYSSTKSVFVSLSAKFKNIKASIYTSMQDDNKLSDFITSLYYKFNYNKIGLKTGLKVYFPTDYNDKTDYAFYIKGRYKHKKYDISLSEKHKVYGESGASSKDTITLSIGTYLKKAYIMPYTYIENSAYDTSNWKNYIGISLIYPLKINNKKLYPSIDFSTQTDEIQNYTLIGSLGYKF